MLEECFDDSSVVSKNNFDFLTVGKEYECKIKLFGHVVFNMQDKAVVCKLIDKNEMVGAKRMAKISVRDNEYYIPETKVRSYLPGESFFFLYTRKDLIQVDDIPHPDAQR